MKKYLAVAIILCGSFLAHAQTPLHKQAPDTTDRCANSADPMQNSDIYSCAMHAMSNDNYRIALRWLRKGASRGDSSAQFQLGNIYEDGTGVPKDYLQAYKWFDIAAATHGACIDRLPPGGRQEDNQMELYYRDSVARKMTETQIKEAQRLAREWKPSVYPWKYQPGQFSGPNYTPPTYVQAKSWCDEG